MLREPILLIFSIAAGVILSEYSPFSTPSKLASLFLVLMLWGVMLSLPSGNPMRARGNRVVVLNLALNFAVIPIFAFLMSLRFASQPELMLGLFLYLALPCTDWFLTFTAMARGNVALGILLIPINLSLQLVLLPLYILLFYGASVPLSLELFIDTLLIFFLLPLLMALVSKRVLPAGANLLISKAQTPFLSLAVVSILASQQNAYRSILELSQALSLVVGYLALALLLSGALGRVLGLRREDSILLGFTTSARNSPVALAIATGAFPGMHLTSTLLAVAPVIEIPVLAMAARFLSVKR